eukprot:3319162-Rhodomonas_salina.2
MSTLSLKQEPCKLGSCLMYVCLGRLADRDDATSDLDGDDGADADDNSDHMGMTPVMRAAKDGDKEACEALIK